MEGRAGGRPFAREKSREYPCGFVGEIDLHNVSTVRSLSFFSVSMLLLFVRPQRGLVQMSTSVGRLPDLFRVFSLCR